MQAKNYFDNKEKWYWRREKTPQAYGQLEWGNAITALKRSKWAMKLLRVYNEIVVIIFASKALNRALTFFILEICT